MKHGLDMYRIKQLSIFSENKPGRLMDIAHDMKKAGVNIIVFTIAEGSGFGLIRMLVDKPEDAYEKLTSHGHVVKYTDVLALRMEDRPGGLFDMTERLKEEGINIDYAYGYRDETSAVLILKVEEFEKAIKTILESGRSLIEVSYFQQGRN